MGDRTKIEWTRGEDGTPGATWNPITGCDKVSAGCDRCYAETFAERFRGTEGHYYSNGFDVQLRPDKLGLPLRWRKPRRIFTNSMSDLFHDKVPDEYIARVFAVMALASRHTFQVLTKRHGRMRTLLSSPAFAALVDQESIAYDRSPLGHRSISWPLHNVWLIVSAEDQKWATTRWDQLRQTPAAVRGISAEPLLGPISLCRCDGGQYEVKPQPFLVNDTCPLHGSVRLDWLIVGGESGAGARGMDPQWARSLREQCESAGVAFQFKQTGTVLAKQWGCTGKGGDPMEWPEEFPRQFPTRVLTESISS